LGIFFEEFLGKKLIYIFLTFDPLRYNTQDRRRVKQGVFAVFAASVFNPLTYIRTNPLHYRRLKKEGLILN